MGSTRIRRRGSRTRRSTLISRIEEGENRKAKEKKKEEEKRDRLIKQIKDDCFVGGMDPETVRDNLSLKIETFYDLFVIAQEQDKNQAP